MSLARLPLVIWTVCSPLLYSPHQEHGIYWLSLTVGNSFIPEISLAFSSSPWGTLICHPICYPQDPVLTLWSWDTPWSNPGGKHLATFILRKGTFKGKRWLRSASTASPGRDLTRACLGGQRFYLIRSLSLIFLRMRDSWELPQTPSSLCHHILDRRSQPPGINTVFCKILQGNETVSSAKCCNASTLLIFQGYKLNGFNLHSITHPILFWSGWLLLFNENNRKEQF